MAPAAAQAAAPSASASADQAREHRGELLGVRVVQVVDVDPAAALHRHVELRHQPAHLVELRARREHEQRVRALVGDDLHRRLDRARSRVRVARIGDAAPRGAARVERAAAALGHFGAVDLRDLIGERRRVGVLDRDDRQVLLVGLDVDRLEDLDQPPDVRGRLGQDHRVGRRVGGHRRVLRDERLQRVHDRVGVDVAQRDQARDERVPIGRTLRALHRLDAGLLRLADRHHLDRAAGRHDRGEALHLQYRLEHRVRLFDRDRLGRDDRHAPAHAVVVDEVAVGGARDRLDHLRELGVCEVERDHGARLEGRARGLRTGLGYGLRGGLCGRLRLSARRERYADRAQREQGEQGARVRRRGMDSLVSDRHPPAHSGVNCLVDSEPSAPRTTTLNSDAFASSWKIFAL